MSKLTTGIILMTKVMEKLENGDFAQSKAYKLLFKIGRRYGVSSEIRDDILNGFLRAK